MSRDLPWWGLALLILVSAAFVWFVCRGAAKVNAEPADPDHAPGTAYPDQVATWEQQFEGTTP